MSQLKSALRLPQLAFNGDCQSCTYKLNSSMIEKEKEEIVGTLGRVEAVPRGAAVARSGGLNNCEDLSIKAGGRGP